MRTPDGYVSQLAPTRPLQGEAPPIPTADRIFAIASNTTSAHAVSSSVRQAAELILAGIPCVTFIASPPGARPGPRFGGPIRLSHLATAGRLGRRASVLIGSFPTVNDPA